MRSARQSPGRICSRCQAAYVRADGQRWCAECHAAANRGYRALAQAEMAELASGLASLVAALEAEGARPALLEHAERLRALVGRRTTGGAIPE